MKSPKDVRIAGKKTVGDWDTCRAKLDGSGDPESWKAAYKDFFKARLQSRYFGPIGALQESRELAGEGFSIAAIQCSLIEFFGATIEGKSYRFRRKGDPALGTDEYSDSKDMFVRFLTTTTPFSKVFDKSLALDFYEGVRCGLLHEARTKKGWRIKAGTRAGPILDVKAKIVYRDGMQRAFEEFVDWYGKTLSTDKALQRAFLRKFDGLCMD
ncbi:hypothetical protein N7E70_008615 [Aminobacter sp. NyZ550]|uniref:hypothetical protein n=1 Tax=Aminobacter TaxID=31988 RepID=UPI0021D5AF0A|nr:MULTISPECIES: hypothetical protein [Aminobacter]MDR7222264.1 hypothetical protein [Aminobacter aminovorans]WAX96892.1 hypothetical protein N7E70_008615 [Aminobacter sp. NyZ550]WMC96092.1 hypothetical protein RAR13_22390 [Aminobacter aminovorans]